MKKLCWLILTQLLFLTTVGAQAFNTTLRDQLNYSAELNDVWGYVAPDGTEYALVGLFNGLSIVSLADPDNIVEVDFISGDNSTWRDMKTYGEYAYVVADSGNDGVLIVNLSGLPDGNAVTSQYVIPDPPGAGTIQQAHNIFIDQATGLAYIAGADVNSGGMVIYDVATTPGVLDFVALAPSVYAHDVFVDNGIMYASEINADRLAIYDVSDPSSITLLGTRITPFAFTHNAWSTPDGNFVFTTDERGNASTAAYDISNPANPVLLDEFRPERSLGTGTIPHNAHVLNDYLVISHYTDGVEIVDASVPSNMIEVGYYDSSTVPDGGFFGSWGAYPFLPSGLVLSSDIENGLFVIDVNYIRAARLKGTVTDGDQGPALNGVSITVNAPTTLNTSTDAVGFYQTGTASAGTFSVTYSAAGYESITLDVDFVNGVELVIDTFLNAIGQVSITGQVQASSNNAAIPDANALLVGEGGTFTATSNGSGNLTFTQVPMGDYELFAGKWGWQNASMPVTVEAGASLSIQLEAGYLDGFQVDQGWTATGNATTGDWERGIPNGTTNGGVPINPGEDVQGGTDLGERAYITGNAANASVGSDDIDNGTVTLTSPVLDLSLFPTNNLVISYAYWFANSGGSGAPNDEMTVAIDNGSQTVIAKTYNTSTITNAWVADSFLLTDLPIAITSQMRIVVTAGDTGAGHLAEGGFDNFKVSKSTALPVELLSFSATATDRKEVQLTWATASEIDNDFFAIERSVDGRNFTIIGRLNGIGNSQAVNSYFFLDEQPLVGSNFYRLRQVDVDATETLSQIQQVEIDGEMPTEEWLPLPNPANDYLQLNVEMEGLATIYNQQGQQVLQQALNIADRIDLRGLTPGQYWLRIGGRTQAFVKN